MPRRYAVDSSQQSASMSSHPVHRPIPPTQGTVPTLSFLPGRTSFKPLGSGTGRTSPRSVRCETEQARLMAEKELAAVGDRREEIERLERERDTIRASWAAVPEDLDCLIPEPKGGTRSTTSSGWRCGPQRTATR